MNVDLCVECRYNDVVESNAHFSELPNTIFVNGVNATFDMASVTSAFPACIHCASRADVNPGIVSHDCECGALVWLGIPCCCFKATPSQENAG